MSEPIGLTFDGTDPDPSAPGDVGPAADLVGDDVDDLDRGNFPYGSRFTDEQWDALQEVRRNITPAPEDPA